jgi:putative membrane-bound dehydrogenase-like protein
MNPSFTPAPRVKPMQTLRKFVFAVTCLLGSASGLMTLSAPAQAEDPKPLRALLITGGCCHDYTTQKQLIKEGLEARANIEVTVVQQGGTSTNSKIPLYEDPNWAEGYDVIIHDECFADASDPAWTQRVLKPHQDGIPAVVIHCAMHCYRDGTDEWFKFCGVTSRRHGAHYAHEVLNRDAEHPIMESWGPGWANPAGELYWIEKIWPTAHPLAAAKNREKGNEEVCVWTNDYQGTRVFGTTLGHHNETVNHPKFLELLTRGTLWACGQLNDNYLIPQEPQRVPVNMARGAKATASSEESNKNNIAQHAVDGNPSTRWCAANASAPQWLQIDLGKSQKIRGCKLAWESPTTLYRYRVEASKDGEAWETLVDRSENQQPNGEHEFPEQSVRYVRVTFLGSNGGWGSLWEVELFGEKTELIDPQAQLAEEEAKVLADVTIPDGFKATLFAQPPAVIYPVFVAADPSGTLYVSVDKNGSLDRQPRRGAIYRLRDLDGDGRADEVKLFVADVDSPRGLVWDRDRLYVLHPPHLSAFMDQDDDGIAERQEILVKDLAFTFKDRPADHTSNGVTLGIDGWLYLAIGDFGFMNAEGSDGRKLQFRGGGVVRVRPDGSDMEIYSRGTRNILEVALDPQLNGFTRDNTNDGGGWDIRLHHFSGLDHHGYPTLFKNFADEIVQPLADYGGGSGCGACYVAEPGFPEGFGDALYTADWGRSWVYRHQVAPQGATFTASQEPFVQLPRVTDLDVDGNSRMYLSSWKGASFTYVGEEVGYIVQLTPENAQAPKQYDWKNESEDDLITMLSGTSHRLRLAAQRELLQRGWAISIPGQLNRLAADRNANLESRIAAVYTLALGLGPQAQGPLIELTDDPQLTPFVIRALSEIPHAIDQPAPIRLLQRSLVDENPRTRLEAIRAIARLKVDSLEGPLVDRVLDDDPIVAHTAINALTELELWKTTLQQWKETQDLDQAAQYLLAFQSIHRDELIAAIGKLLPDVSPDKQLQLMIALGRLYHVDGEWKGDSWGTRPDTRGPYYQPETWEGSAKILELILKQLGTFEPEWSEKAVAQLQRHRLSSPDLMAVLLAKAEKDRRHQAAFLSGLAAQPAPYRQAASLLQTMIEDPKTESSTLAQALQASWRIPSSSTSTVIEGLERLKSLDEENYAATWTTIRDPKSVELHRDELLQALADDASMAPRALAMLLAIASTPGGRKPASAQVDDTLQNLWETPEGQNLWLEGLRLAQDPKWETKIWQLTGSSDQSLAESASQLAKQMKLQPLIPAEGPSIKELGAAEVMKQLGEPQGHEQRGQLWFAKLNCANCHTVSPGEAPRGPYLPNVAKTYNRAQLAEAILEPSKTLAQGFVTEIFSLEDGNQVTGFVTEEAATRITLRDAEGREIILSPEEIEDRAKQSISVMPEGLVDTLGPQDLRDLLDYLQSLGKLAEENGKK